ncbi:aminotransferase class I/II-fold pyridoxal phosphate-dependent enzyme [Halovivax gelatinilyticus]|uniref:aminotransferase class I/II-fold pyridoxal phosphate-dependent enzyme n=1 Tax=Halovivax gelatinilyticus TaxID=2961597 RepID=UPI0020CA7583|nr:aminotransferase class I/II-fold pyridoxal phosphate-dependent enzyme [Halovivax gelatinilyticus]
MVDRGFDPSERVRELRSGRETHRLRPSDRIAERVYRAQPSGESLPVLDGTETLVFGSENYLGLAHDRRIQEAATRAARTVGTGACSSRVRFGDTLLHHDLERTLAEVSETERALSLPDRSDAYRLLIAGLQPDAVFVDDLSARFAEGIAQRVGSTLLRYDQTEISTLEAKFQAREALDADGCESWLAVVPAVCPIRGEACSPREFVSLASEYGAWTAVDETHAIGLYADGGGIVQAENCPSDVDVQLGSLSTALASQGGYVAASTDVIETIVNTSDFERLCAISPPSAAAASEALHVARHGSCRAQLWDNVTHLREGLRSIGYGVSGDSQILSVPVEGRGEPGRLVRALSDSNVLVRVAGPPDRSQPADRLLVTPLASHGSDDIVECLTAFASARESTDPTIR